MKNREWLCRSQFQCSILNFYGSVFIGDHTHAPSLACPIQGDTIYCGSHVRRRYRCVALNGASLERRPLMTNSPHARAQSATIQLYITLLGPPQLNLLGTPVPLPRRQLRALLYRLAVTLQPVSREHICFLLWPDIPETAARRHLTVLLNQLRQ